MKKMLACLTAVCCLAGGFSTIAVSADDFNESKFHVVAKNPLSDSSVYVVHYYDEIPPPIWLNPPKYWTDFMKLEPETASARTGDKVSDYQYGDILVIDIPPGASGFSSGFFVQSSYPPRYRVLCDDAEIHYVGNCKELLESKELTLTKKEEKAYYGSTESVESITFYFEDDAGNEYSYPESYYTGTPEIDLNLYDIGDTVTFFVYHDTLILPLKEELLQPELMKGDASGDDEINVLDVIEINRAVLGKTTLTEEQTKAADVDGNGIIDAADSLLILKYLVGIVEAL